MARHSERNGECGAIAVSARFGMHCTEDPSTQVALYSLAAAELSGLAWNSRSTARYMQTTRRGGLTGHV